MADFYETTAFLFEDGYRRPGMVRTQLPKELLVLALLVAFLVACSSDEQSPGAVGQGVYIPAHWQTTRDVEGHRVHVRDERVACTGCHEFTETTVGRVAPSRCAECHEEEGKIKHAEAEATERFGADSRADCTSCHVFALFSKSETLPKGTTPTSAARPHALDGKPFLAGDCVRCHATNQEDNSSVIVHRSEECLSCHHPHQQESPVSAPCGECHEEIATTHASAGRSGLETCTTCHTKQHAPGKDAIGGCATCHTESEPIIPSSALFEDGHSECIDCHRPHEFEKEKATSCRSCHEDILVLGGGRIARHNACANCHRPHDVKTAAASACASCHKAINPNHPRHKKAGSCTGCHDPHPQAARAQTKVRDCSTCHTGAANEKSFHAGEECQACHVPHDFMLADAGTTLCAKCHAGNMLQRGKVTAHGECSECHGGLPHRPTKSNIACGTCHKNQVADVKKGHTDCIQCHEPHKEKLTRECRTCHATELRQSSPGHRNCVSCHQPHSGKQKKPACGSCHARQARSPHGEISPDCSTCHRPHGPKGIANSPNCATCHKRSELFGLHSVAKHAQCAGCHTNHGEQETPLRLRCLSCHQDSLDHFPKSSTCTSCHVFVATR